MWVMPLCVQVKGARKQKNLRTTRAAHHLGAIILSWFQRPQHGDVIRDCLNFLEKTSPVPLDPTLEDMSKG